MVRTTFNEKTGLLDIKFDEPRFEVANKECISEVDASSIFVTINEMDEAIQEINKALAALEKEV